MLIRKLIVSVALAATTAVPLVSHAAPAQRPPCILGEHHIVSVQPYRVDERIGRNVFPQLRGAQVYIQAEPGLTAEWLELTLERHLAEMRGPATMRECAFDLDNVRVTVVSAGSGFW